jgi:hypothetical protein
MTKGIRKVPFLEIGPEGPQKNILKKLKIIFVAKYYYSYINKYDFNLNLKIYSVKVRKLCLNFSMIVGLIM